MLDIQTWAPDPDLPSPECDGCHRFLEDGDQYIEVRGVTLCLKCVTLTPKDEPAAPPKRYNLAIDFDGVCSDYSDGWGKGDADIRGKPVDGLFAALREYQVEWDLWIHSVRCRTVEGQRAIAQWFERFDGEWKDEQREQGYDVAPLNLNFSAEKPVAWAYIDDRGFRFEGVWPTRAQIRALRCWWRKEGGV